MVQWLEQAAPNAPYLVIFGVLLATGFGLPLPEDIPLVLAGAMCGDAAARDSMHPAIWVMMPGCMVAILGSDLVLYYLGRWIGPSIHRHPILKRIVGSRNLARAKVMFKRHDAKFVFFARFLPGVRAPAFFTAGMYKMKLRNFLRWDGAAAFFSAPWVMLLGYFLHGEVNHTIDLISSGKTWGFVIVGGIIIVFVAFHWYVNKRFASSVPETIAEKQAEPSEPDETPDR